MLNISRMLKETLLRVTLNEVKGLMHSGKPRFFASLRMTAT